MKKEIYEAYSIIGDLTPLCVDCGELCDRACCEGREDDSDETGMLLFPSEEDLFENSSWGHITDTEYVLDNGRVIKLFVCDEYCDRSQRPLSCRIFPLFYDLDRGSVITDIRGKGLCPLCFFNTDEEFETDFVTAVDAAFKTLINDEECKSFISLLNEEFRFYI